MSSTLVDSNVLVDLFDEDSEWRDWSEAMPTRCASRGALVINPIVFAEVSAGFGSIDDVAAALPEAYLRREPLPWQAAFWRVKPSCSIGGVAALCRRSGFLHRRPRRGRVSYAVDA